MSSGKKAGTVRGKIERPRIIRALIRCDGLVCWICGRPIDPAATPNTKERLSIDHVVPRSDGGIRALTNLRLAHAGCNNAAGGQRTRPGKTSAREAR